MNSKQSRAAIAPARRALVICAHLRPGRDKRTSHYFMQPIAGLHAASLIDRRHFDVHLYHEDWHGPLEPSKCAGYDLVFLSGLQPDFDRMRQLSYYFRRSGAAVVAGGSVCSTFPEFAAQFFDAVCVGGVDSVREVVDDFISGALKKIYRSPANRITSYSVDHGLLATAGINPLFHLMEASRGCSFKCSFCVVPAEVGTHARYELETLRREIDNAIASAPLTSFRRWFPMINFQDNNFSDDRAHMLAVVEMLAAHPRIKGWSALVTQNTLHDRDLVRKLARSKCMLLFVGLESLDRDTLRRYNKKQNLSRQHNVIDDVAFAESLGIALAYGYLFDYRLHTAEEMKRQILAIANHPYMPMPVYLSVVAPLAGTASFWEDLRRGELAPNLQLRNLDGETVCHSKLADRRDTIIEFIEPIFRHPWKVVPRWTIVKKTLRRIVRSGSWNPWRWYVMASANLHCFIWSSATPSQKRTYVAGTDALDPQYFERPADLTEEDRLRYFEPIYLTDAHGNAMEWLRPYVRQPEVPTRKVKLHA
jgi:radical SAM superfamily enzyme YgiQ (UPF0313 family)